MSTPWNNNSLLTNYIIIKKSKTIKYTNNIYQLLNIIFLNLILLLIMLIYLLILLIFVLTFLIVNTIMVLREDNLY